MSLYAAWLKFKSIGLEVVSFETVDDMNVHEREVARHLNLIGSTENDGATSVGSCNVLARLCGLVHARLQYLNILELECFGTEGIGCFITCVILVLSRSPYNVLFNLEQSSCNQLDGLA